MRKPPPGTALTYAYGGHLVFRLSPGWFRWNTPACCSVVMSTSCPGRRFLAKAFASPYCKKIMCEYEVARHALLTTVDCAPFIDKVAVVLPPPPPLPRFEKPPQKGPVNCSLSVPATSKVNLLRAVSRKLSRCLSSSVKNTTASNWSCVPICPPLLPALSGIPGLRIIDRSFPRSLEQEFAAADIFVLPSHGTYPFTLMEAMSWELSCGHPEFLC